MAGQQRYWFRLNIREIRMERKLSINDLSKFSGVSHPTVARADRGEPIASVNADTVVGLAFALGVNWDDILEIVETDDDG